MNVVKSDSHLLPLILKAVCSVKNDAWCFVPAHSSSVTHCSRAFLDMWGVDADVPDESGRALPLAESSLADQLEHLGLHRDWLLEFCRSDLETEIRVPEPCPVSLIQRTTIYDDSGYAVGLMLCCHNRATVSVPPEVLFRAVQSKRMISVLTPRESEILELVFDGLTNKAVGARTQISEKTVEKHRSNIMRKLGTKNVADLIRRVTEANLIAQT